MERWIRLPILALIGWVTVIVAPAILPVLTGKQSVPQGHTLTIKSENDEKTLHNGRWVKYEYASGIKTRPEINYRAIDLKMNWCTALKKRSPGSPSIMESAQSDWRQAPWFSLKAQEKEPAPLPLLQISDRLTHTVRQKSLPKATEADRIRSTPVGIKPSSGDNDRRPLNIYAKPFNQRDKRPRIGIVVTGLGLSDAATEAAIQALPGGVTLAFAPYSSKLESWIKLARASGHEVLINIPMEPNNYPAYNPGPQTLLTSLSVNDNLNRLYLALSRATGYVGVVDFLGSRFTESRRNMLPVLDAINQRGLLYLDSGSSPRSIASALAQDLEMTFATATLTLDKWASRKNIDRKFAELEKRAKSGKQAIGIASPYPVTLEKISDWAVQLRARGVVLAPISALSQKNMPVENR